MVTSSSWVGTPRPTDNAPCGSKSTSSTLRPYSARAAPRLMVVVVLPTPPFWLHMAMIRAGPWLASGAGSGNSGNGRPVTPSWPAPADSVPGRACGMLDSRMASSSVVGSGLVGSGLVGSGVVGSVTVGWGAPADVIASDSMSLPTWWVWPVNIVLAQQRADRHLLIACDLISGLGDGLGRRPRVVAGR